MPKPIPISQFQRHKSKPVSPAKIDISSVFGDLTEGFLATILEASPNCLTIIELPY